MKGLGEKGMTCSRGFWEEDVLEHRKKGADRQAVKKAHWKVKEEMRLWDQH